MAKAKLSTVTEKWINGKTEKHQNIKTKKMFNSKKEKQQDLKDEDQKKMQTIYISKKASKILWYRRVETGQPISHIVEQLVLDHLR